ncbi:MAG: SIS domain-containing protein [Oscillospiraceae bacterium]
MVCEASNNALSTFLTAAQEEFSAFAATINCDTYDRAAALILESQKAGGRVHITGIGKPGHVAAYMASLLSSTGTPTYFLHGTEAVHGSCGQLVAGDVVICISNSGETAELKATALAVRNNGCKIIAVTGNEKSWLAQFADAHLFAGVSKEGGPLNRAPRCSILAETLTLQALSVVLQAHCGQTPEQYVRCHPGGSLGALRADER